MKAKGWHKSKSNLGKKQKNADKAGQGEKEIIAKINAYSLANQLSRLTINSLPSLINYSFQLLSFIVAAVEISNEDEEQVKNEIIHIWTFYAESRKQRRENDQIEPEVYVDQEEENEFSKSFNPLLNSNFLMLSKQKQILLHDLIEKGIELNLIDPNYLQHALLSQGSLQNKHEFVLELIAGYHEKKLGNNYQKLHFSLLFSEVSLVSPSTFALNNKLAHHFSSGDV